MKDLERLEAKGLKVAALILLFMGVLGIVTSRLSNSTAILIDGFFSLISAGSTLIAIKVSSLLTRRSPDYPFGYSGYEPLYVILRSFLLIVTVLLALADSVSKIVAYSLGREIPGIDANIFMIYVVFIAAMYMILFRHYTKYLTLTENKSQLLYAERFNAKANSIIMLGVGGSFLVILLLKFTPLNFLAPIGDSLIVLILCSIVFFDTVKLLVKTISILGGRGIESEEKEELLGVLRDSTGVDISDLKVQKLGKTAYIVLCMEGNDLKDSAREEIESIVSQKYDLCHMFLEF